MGYFKDSQQFYQIFGEFMKRVVSHPEVGPKLQKAKIKIRFNYTDPEASILLNFADPAPPGQFGNYELGDKGTPADVTMTQSADFTHRYWQGKENAVTALATKKIKASGAVQKALGLVTAIRPTFAIYKQVLKELGYENLIVE
ncbi:SCP2 sterol-binding domain-containing protein [Candidatus Poribacteria bacterium]|nr:SCP2 sterol-binding domain-containing protein [Candidatus Poribacteria bacterium]